MEISKDAMTWNLGDTSFRRKALIHDYIILLQELYELNNINMEWNEVTQSQYYFAVRKNKGINISSKENDPEKTAKMGRTFTSGLFKLGFCNKKRELSEIGLQLLGYKDVKLDNIEKRLGLKKDNIIFLRQLLKLEICNKGSQNAFKPFIFLIKLLNKYGSLTKEEFEAIIQLSSCKVDFEKVINEFYKVKNNEKTLDEFFEEYIGGEIDSVSMSKFIEDDSLDENLFKQIFFNRKTEESRNKYLEFYKKLLEYKQDYTNQDNLDELIILIKDKVISKAFGTNRIFKIKERTNKFEEFNKKFGKVDIIALKGKAFRSAFIKMFFSNKREDIVKEYRDMTYRIFNTTGIIDFRNNKIKFNNLYAKEYFKTIDEKLIICSCKKNEFIFKAVSMTEIFNEDNTDIVDAKIKEKYNLDDQKHISEYLNLKEKNEFENFIKNTFKKKNIIEILELIKQREDKKIFELVTDQATIPTIFEYILGIAWLYISGFDFDLYNSLNLTLDSSYYPLSHAAGGNGDIIITYNNPNKHTLMLEATLMDINAQKRGELEPVIRHATNLTIDNKKKCGKISSTYTFFIANELDNNVINIFRGCNLLKLEHSKQKGEFINNVKIMAFTIEEIILILKWDIKYDKILDIVKNEFEIKNVDHINDNWRDNLIKDILLN